MKFIINSFFKFSISVLDGKLTTFPLALGTVIDMPYFLIATLPELILFL